jgi:hypothetical protein
VIILCAIDDGIAWYVFDGSVRLGDCVCNEC